MMATTSECLGAKRCPRASNNRARWLCSDYTRCATELIHKELRRTNSIVRTLKATKAVLNSPDGYGFSDFILLCWIARVADRDGIRYGRKKVDRALRLSNIDADGACAPMEKSLVRASFNVYGRKGARSAHTGRTEDTELPNSATKHAHEIDASPDRADNRETPHVAPAVVPLHPAAEPR